MKKSSIAAALLIAGSLSLSWAYAADVKEGPNPQDPTPHVGGHPHPGGHGMKDRMQHRAKHLSELKQALKLSPEQEQAWNTFTAKHHDHPGQHQSQQGTGANRHCSHS